MRKRYLFLMLLFTIATMFLSSNAYAADPPKAEYDAAMAAIKDGSYYIVTEVDGIEYYVTTGGGLTEFKEDGGLFMITKVSGGALYDVGLNIDPGNGGHFSNTTLSDSKAVLHPDPALYRQDTSNNRDDWERQVFFMNEEGKFAIRSCNTAYGESSWADAGRAFWTYEIADPEFDPFPSPCYSYEPAYIWTLQTPPDVTQIWTVLNSIIVDYEESVWDDGDGASVNLGTEFGQRADAETWQKFYALLQSIYETADKIHEDGYDLDTDPNAPTLAWAEEMKATCDSMYNKILASEVPYMMPQDGYYRIIAHNRFLSTYDESGMVDKAMMASYEKEHENKACYGTLKKNMANYLWKLTQHGDSIFIQNAGMGTYISFSSPAEGRIIMTDDINDASHIQFDYAYAYDDYTTLAFERGPQYVEPYGEGDYRDIFSIRLASQPRGGNYFHQNNHSSTTDDNSPWGNYGKDTGMDQEISFWMRTWDYHDANGNRRTTDLNTSEWYLEFVPEAEAEKIIEDFEMIKNHDLLVAKNAELRAQVAETLALAKDVIKTKMITSVDQLDNRFGDPSEGTNIGNLIDNDPATFWHTTWHGLAEGVESMWYYGAGYEEEGRETHYLQISGMEKLVGNCQLYLRERDGADNDRVKTLVLMGTDNLKNEDEDWEEIAVITLPHTGKGEENTVNFTVADSYPYIRLLVIDTDYSSYAFRQFWHAAEIQLYTLEDNPNSQFVLMGEVAQALQDTYDANLAVEDADITPEIYQALVDAYEAFMSAGLVDPAELRAALAQYAKVTEGVVEGKNPGQWSDMTVPNAYNELYAEVQAYDKAGKYNLVQIHKYIVMLKAMQKSVMEQANGITTDKWYRIMVPTEEMYDAFNFSKEGVDKTSLREDQIGIMGTFVAPANEITEEVPAPTEEDPDAVANETHLEAIGGEDLRESDRLFFMAEDEIEDKATSLFRFVEREADAADYTPLFSDVKENMSMALDMSTTYTKGEALITKASQFSSNASYPGNDGQKLESGCLIDNNLSTYWHSDYSRTYCEVPYLQVALNEPVSGLIEVYVGRRNASNGHVVRMYVQGSTDAEKWINIGYIETPYIDAATPVTSQPLDLGGEFSHLRFIMTNRYGTDGGSNIEFDPFAENLTADDYNTKFTYFHASEFQIYPVTADKELSESGKALQEAYTTANRVVLKDATAENLAAAAQAYKAYKDEFNNAQGKTVLPNGVEKAPSTYALQNKATGLFVYVDGTGNQNGVYLKTIPTMYTYKALGYERSLLGGTNLAGQSTNYMHAGESNRRFCTWSTTEPTTNSGLVVCEADEEYAVPEVFTFTKNVKPGRIIDWCHSVTLTQEPADEAFAYTALGQYTDDNEEIFLALKKIETIEAGQPALFICGDTTLYDAEDDYVEPIKFTIPGKTELVYEGAESNGLIGTLVTRTLKKDDIYFNANYVAHPASDGSLAVTPCSAILNLDNCPEVDPAGEYDFSICLSETGTDVTDGVKNVSVALEQISKPGNVYSMDGKLLRTGATLNSLKSLGKGAYILNGVKVLVK